MKLNLIVVLFLVLLLNISNYQIDNDATIRQIEFILKNLKVSYFKTKQIFKNSYFTILLSKINDYDHEIPKVELIQDSTNPNKVILQNITSLYGVSIYFLIAGFRFQALIEQNIYQVFFDAISFTKTENEKLIFNDYNQITVIPNKDSDLMQLKYFNGFEKANEEIKREIDQLTKTQFLTVTSNINQLIADVDFIFRSTQKYYDKHEVSIFILMKKILSIQIVGYDYKPENIDIINEDKISIKEFRLKIIYTYELSFIEYNADGIYNIVNVNKKSKVVSYFNSKWIIDEAEPNKSDVELVLNTEIFGRFQRFLLGFFDI